MNIKTKTLKIITTLKRLYPKAKCSLHFNSPLQLLIATVLSAQCTDERVNIVTKDLFKKYKTAKDYAKAKQSMLGKDIHSVGFYNNKSKSIIKCCKDLVAKHKGKVPKTMEEMVKLAGVARKTANVVLGNAYRISSGIAVDTHVMRLSQRLGLSKQKDPKKIEQDLNELKEDYNRTKEKIDGDNPQERGKKAAGWLLKNIYGIPGADKLIDILDRKQKEDNR
ncbi:MAG: endonuclease III [Candidatus Margulisbacteria bacterium]|nr:endonuclease III [Candidatus Margulisiibacteriota bacterium]